MSHDRVDAPESSDDSPNAPPTSAAAAADQLSALRQAITALDSELLQLLARRRECARGVARTKASDGRSVRDQDREQDLLAGLIERGRAAGLDAHYVTRVFHLIIDDSIRLQQSMLLERSNPQQPHALRVAFQGDKGSYSHVAICQHFADRLDEVTYIGFDAFADVIQAVENGTADYAMLPIENTTSGGINEVYDLLMHTPLSVVGEETVPIDHCLLAHPDATVEGLTRVYAHPQGFAQCSNFVARLKHCRLESLETAEAVRRAAADPEHRAAAIASTQAGELYGLEPLVSGIANQRENVTRFLCVSRQARRVPPQVACKSSLVMATSDAPGSLVEALQLFREEGISIAKLESRPIIGNPWEEMFYLDVECNLEAPPMRRTLEQLAHVTRYLKVLGCYPTTRIPVTDVPPDQWVADRREAADQAAPALASATAVAATAANAMVRLGNIRIAPEDFTFIAVPRSTSDGTALKETARLAREYGARVLALGLHGSGLELSPEHWREQLAWLRDAGDAAGLATMASVSRPDQVAIAAAHADALRVPARHMENVDLLKAVGRTARPVLLTRGGMSSLDELLHAASLVSAEGNRQLMLCEAGISTFESATNATLDVSAIAILRTRCAMPVLLEPLAALSAPALCKPLVAAAAAAGASGAVLTVQASAGDSPDLEPPADALSMPALADVIADTLRKGAPYGASSGSS